MENQGKIIICSWFYFKSVNSMQFQTVEEVEDVCKLLSVVTKYSWKKTNVFTQFHAVAALLYFKPPLRDRQLSHTEGYE